MHSRNDALYTREGREVVFDHEHEGVAYVRPLLTTYYQSTNHHGDDFDEVEETNPADHLEAIAMDDLFVRKPVEVLDAQVEERKAELNDLSVQIAKERKAHQAKITAADTHFGSDRTNNRPASEEVGEQAWSANSLIEWGGAFIDLIVSVNRPAPQKFLRR